MHEYSIKGSKVPTFVTSDVQMVIEVNFAAGDKFQIGYRSVAEKVGPRIPRTKAQTSTLSTPTMLLENNSPLHVPTGRISGGYDKTFGYRKPTYNPFTPEYDYGYAKTAPIPRLTTSNEILDESPGKKSKDISVSSRQSKDVELKGKIIESKSKNRKNSIIVGLLWTFAIIFTITGTSALVYFKYKDRIDTVRRRTEQRLEAKL